jgi:cytochrome c-type biogenesis protein CcmH/NrfG
MKATRFSVGIALLGVLVTMAWFAALRFAAEMTAQDARYRAARWEAGKAGMEAKELNAAVASLRAALALEPGNPNLHSDLGRIDYLRVRSGSAVDPESRAARQSALAGFRQAAQLRPTSGHTWTMIALNHYMLGQIDSEFAHALEQSLRWAPWQPQLQLTCIQLGLATWGTLGPATQRLLSEAIRHQAEWKMTDQKPALIRLLRAYGRMELGCLWAGAALGCPGA